MDSMATRVWKSRPLFAGVHAVTLVLIWIVIGCFPGVSHGFDRYNRVRTFDTYFSKYAKRFFGPAFDWHFFKAQAIAESRLDPRARSKVGAAGVMQIMPRTFEEIKRKNPAVKGNRMQPRWNIAAGIYYDRMIWKLFKSERPFQDRLNFMFGAYNAGKGNILKAQKIAAGRGLNPNLWGSIERSLPRVTGKRSRETLGYVNKIEEIKGVLK
jgi:membrane-bound lytic murein transglycosylase MltF